MSYLFESPANPDVHPLGGVDVLLSPIFGLSFVITVKEVILLKLFEAPIAVLF